MSEMQSSESFERIWESLGRAASCCRELHIVTKIKDWGELSNQFLIMRKKAKAMYDGKPLSEVEVMTLVSQIENAQKAAGMLR